MANTYYCVAQMEYTIMGVGRSKAAAVRDANKWLHAGEKISLKEIENNEPMISGMTVVKQCSPAVYAHIKAGGNPTKGWMWDGRRIVMDYE